MGRRGPPKEPTAIRLIKGNTARRPLNDREPQPPKQRPRCPAWLTPGAKRVWKRLIPVLEQMGVLTLIDGDAIAAYCQAFDTWREATKVLRRHGMTVRSHGAVKPRPEWQIAQQALRTMRDYQRELGMTPAARAGIRIPDGAMPKESTLDRLRKRRHG